MLSIMTDKGPGHYGQRHHFYNMTKGPNKWRAQQGLPPLDLDQAFFAPHHGKCNLDALHAVLKSLLDWYASSHHQSMMDEDDIHQLSEMPMCKIHGSLHHHSDIH